MKNRNEKAYKNKNQLNGSMKKNLKIEGNQTENGNIWMTKDMRR